MRVIHERELDVDGVRVFYRETDGAGVPTLFVHGNPTSSAQWLPFLERLQGRGIALDVPGFGRSQRPPADSFDYSMHGLGAMVAGFTETLGLDRYKLVAQDWGGGLGLISAQRRPQAVEGLVLMDAVPLLPGYRWHRIARLWRTRGVGEASNATLTRPVVALILRDARAGHEQMPEQFVDLVWESIGDKTTRSAILALYRSANPRALVGAGANLASLRCPALILWGGQDPYVPARFAQAYADALGGPAEVEVLDDAGHWPWLDRPDLVDRVVAFLAQT